MKSSGTAKIRLIDTPKELRDILLEVLDDIDAFCRKNGIPYFLFGGSLLGAVRHQGFIPWDDDIDIAMPREAFDRFIACYESDVCDLVWHGNRKTYFYPFAKVCHRKTILVENRFPATTLGVHVDVFPIDTVPDMETAAAINEMRKRTFFLLGLRNRPLSSLRGEFRHWRWRTLQALFLRLLPNKFFVERFLHAVRMAGARTPAFEGNAIWGYGLKEWCPLGLIGHGGKDVSFEGKRYPGLADPHGYLTHIYGDYMKLPPSEKRCTCHDFKAWALYD